MRVPIFEDCKDESEGEKSGGEDVEDEEEKVFLKPVIEDRNMELARKCTELISEIHYRGEYKKSKDKCTFVTDTPLLNHVKHIGAFISEAKYKGTVKADLSNSLYKQMPATIDSVFAREVSQLQSEVLYKQKHDAAKGTSDYSHMKEPPDVIHAMETSKHQSNVSYRKDAEENHKYNAGIDRSDIKMATQVSKIISNAEYKKGKGEMNKEPAVIGRPDFKHAMEASKLSSQVKYREKFDNEMKDKKHQYNPLESASFRQSQFAATLASDVQYKKDAQMMHDPVSYLPSLFLDHALKTSKMLSDHEYKKLFEESKGSYHFETDTAEHLHHKGNTALQSQVKYKEEYEKAKGKSMLEFVDTPSYQASKEAQKMQSEKIYRKDFEKGIKGRPSLDLDKTPEFLHVKYVTNLLKEKEYRKDLENEIKGKGMELSSEIPDIQRAKRASEMASEKEYKKDLENEIKGRGMQIGTDTLDIQRAKKASEISSQKEYKRDLETEIKGKGMQVGTDTLDIQRAKKASEMASQKEYKRDLENEIKGKGMQVSMDIPDMLRAKRASEIYSQKKYKGKAEKMLTNYSTVADTPEIQRIKAAQKNISMVFYKKGVGAGTAVKETPEIERVKKNQQNISSVKYKEEIKQATTISDLPELKRVKENQKNISNLQYREQNYKATPVCMTPEIERVKRNQEHLSLVKYRGESKCGTSISDPPELKRVKENQKNLSNVHYKGQLGRATAISVTPEMERVKKNQENISSVKYTQDQKQMKGRPSLIVDTPGLRHVKETQNNISMVKYHEDFEKTKGRGFTPVVDDPVTERVRKNTQVVSDAAYKGIHPQIVEMDRRPGIIVDLKVWRTDPGSIFDIDPLEDNIQSRSLHMLSEKASLYSRHRSHSTSTLGVGPGDDKSEISETNPSFSFCSELTRPSDEEGAPVLPGAYQQSQSQGYGYMHQTSMSSMRSMQHSPSLRTYRAMYDYSAQDEDEVSFRDGDYIVNVQPIDDGWMYGTVQRTGKTGMLPANYIEFVN
ncbi:nebulette isoform X4 [Dromiciops gliroides]|uniref:nebulette isoform X4 n=1 Tax=Dromiciops gliroides TaxID=33562 RepID=UPI001CC48709|nr:nebulette isoform X4 [Dromiciops gliroides]